MRYTAALALVASNCVVLGQILAVHHDAVQFDPRPTVAAPDTDSNTALDPAHPAIVPVDGQPHNPFDLFGPGPIRIDQPPAATQPKPETVAPKPEVVAPHVMPGLLPIPIFKDPELNDTSSHINKPHHVAECQGNHCPEPHPSNRHDGECEEHISKPHHVAGCQGDHCPEPHFITCHKGECKEHFSKPHHVAECQGDHFPTPHPSKCHNGECEEHSCCECQDESARPGCYHCKDFPLHKCHKPHPETLKQNFTFIKSKISTKTEVIEETKTETDVVTQTAPVTQIVVSTPPPVTETVLAPPVISSIIAPVSPPASSTSAVPTVTPTILPIAGAARDQSNAAMGMVAVVAAAVFML